jgi:signal transduction histidine kinase
VHPAPPPDLAAEPEKRTALVQAVRTVQAMGVHDTEEARLRQRLAEVEERAWRLSQRNRVLQSEVEQRRLAEQLALDQSAMLLHSMDFLASDSHVDAFLGHVLTTMVDQLAAVGGTLWFPDPERGTARLHLEYIDGRVIPARESRHPAVLKPPPVGGGPLSTFPVQGAETYLLCYEVSGMPERNREYIMSLGVKTLLTVPMNVGTERVGWICIRSNRIDTEKMKSQIRVAEALARQAALAIRMADLSSQARKSAVLEERNRIARDIHDTLAQGLTGVILNLEASARALKKDTAARAAEHIEHARELAQQGLSQARDSVRALRPGPEQGGAESLLAQLQLLVRSIQDTAAVSARLQLLGEPRPVAPEQAVEMLRIAQESTTNVLRHARARQILVQLSFEEQCVALTVSDDGCGFCADLHHEGFGLLGMAERAQRIGAALSIHSVPAQGTRISLTVPDTTGH